MRKLFLSLTMAALGLLVLANVALAFGGSGSASDMLQFTGTDQVSGGEAFWIIPWSTSMVDRWGNAYNWHPQTTNIRLYTDGTMMAHDFATFRGSPLSADDFGFVSQGAGAVTTPDNRPGGPGGFTIFVNLSSPQFGGGVAVAPYYRPAVRSAITMELAKLMTSDLAGTNGPMWLSTGLVNYLTENEAPGSFDSLRRYAALGTLMGESAAPTLTQLQNNWTGITGTSPQFMDGSIAASAATVRLLVPQIGVNGVVQILQQAAMGKDINSLFMAQTGKSLSGWDTAYQAPVTSTVAALNAAAAGALAGQSSTP